MQDFGIVNGRIYLDGEFILANLYVKDGKISQITKERSTNGNEVDAKGCMVLPGFVDPHVHFHLGTGERVSSDDFYSGSQKGALGGVTTYIDFLDPVKKAEDIAEKFHERQQLASKSLTDYAFHTTIAHPDSAPQDIIRESKKYGITSVKLFTTYSDTDRRTYDEYILELLQCSGPEKIKVVVHAENDEMIWNNKNIPVSQHEKSRCVLSENSEIMKLAAMARKTGGNLYLVHVSAGSSVRKLVSHYPKELHTGQITIESCPHYFLFNSGVYEQKDGYRYTMAPPLRSENEVSQLRELIHEVHTIGTDHCPFDEKFKMHEFTSQIAMGIAGIQYSFLNMYTLFQNEIIDKFTKAPAKAYGLYPNKGSLLPGTDADIVIFNEKAQTIVEDKQSLYDGKKLTGRIEKVFLRGEPVVSDNRLYPTQGQYIRR